MKSANYLVISLPLGFAAACGQGVDGKAPAETPAAARAAARSEARAEARAEARNTPVPRAVLEVPAGAHLSVTLGTAMSSKTSQAGDRIEARLTHDLLVQSKLVAREGSVVSGQVTAAVPSGRVKTRARLAFVFDKIVVEGGAEHAIATRAVDITADDSHTRDAVTIGGAAGAGAIIGGIIDGGKGAGLGALIGAGAGTGVVLIDKGKNINIAAGGALSLELTEPLRIRE
jgi:hypothetical protein